MVYQKHLNITYGGHMNLLKSLLALSLVAITGMSLTGCTDGEVGFTAGAIVGAIVADPGPCCYYSPNPPRYHGRGWRAADASSALSAAQTVALKYDLTTAQAEALTSRLLPAQHGDLSGLADLGFSVEDLKAIYAGQNPSASTLMTVSQKLGMDLEQAHELIQNIKADAMSVAAQMK
jgi:hypothetical protein